LIIDSITPSPSLSNVTCFGDPLISQFSLLSGRGLMTHVLPGSAEGGGRGGGVRAGWVGFTSGVLLGNGAIVMVVVES
jgi:hypothetical protein